MTQKKAYHYFETAYRALDKNCPHAINDKDMAFHCLSLMAWKTAAELVKKMNRDEFTNWCENRELPPWAPEFLQL